jgi:hypothetical protein
MKIISICVWLLISSHKLVSGGSSSGSKSSSISKTTSTSKSSSSSKTSSITSYKSSPYRYSSSSYRPLQTGNSFMLFYLYEMTYLQLNFVDVAEEQYCPLKGCRIINETTVNTPLRRNVTIFSMMHHGNSTNATTLNAMLTTTYGCSIQFDRCITSNTVRSLHSYTMFHFMIGIISTYLVMIIPR